MGFQNLLKDRVFIIRPTGERIGPLNATVQPSEATIMPATEDISEADMLARVVPGREEMYTIVESHFSRGSPPHIPTCYRLKIRKASLPQAQASASSQTINISNSTGVQVGNHNTQHIQATFNELIQQIDRSSASPAEKAEAKSRLASFVGHPVVKVLLGAAATAVLGTLRGP